MTQTEVADLTWRARIESRVVSFAKRRDQLDTAAIMRHWDAVAGLHLYVDVRTPDTSWFCVEDFSWDGAQLVQQGVIPHVVPDAVLIDITDPTVTRTHPRRRGQRVYPTSEIAEQLQKEARRGWGRRSVRKHRRQRQSPEERRASRLRSQKWAKAQLRNPDPTGPAPLSRGKIAPRAEPDEPSPTVAPAGLACEHRSWILRGLYQEQWTAKLDQSIFDDEDRQQLRGRPSRSMWVPLGARK